MNPECFHTLFPDGLIISSAQLALENITTITSFSEGNRACSGSNSILGKPPNEYRAWPVAFTHRAAENSPKK